MGQLRAYCDVCKENQPCTIGDILKKAEGRPYGYFKLCAKGKKAIDSLNPPPWGNITCDVCSVVIATLSADVEGRVVFKEHR